MMQFDDFEKEGVVDEEIQPRKPGRVYFRNTWWPARCLQDVTLVPGESCYVVDIHNITLLVKPWPFD